MLNRLLKIAAPALLLLALVFMTGAVSASAALYGQATAKLCCAHDTQSPVPATDGACTASECCCLSCSLPLLHLNHIDLAGSGEYRVLSWRVRQPVPASPVASIDYPPENS